MRGIFHHLFTSRSNHGPPAPTDKASIHESAKEKFVSTWAGGIHEATTTEPDGSWDEIHKRLEGEDRARMDYLNRQLGIGR